MIGSCSSLVEWERIQLKSLQDDGSLLCTTRRNIDDWKAFEKSDVSHLKLWIADTESDRAYLSENCISYFAVWCIWLLFCKNFCLLAIFPFVFVFFVRALRLTLQLSGYLSGWSLTTGLSDQLLLFLINPFRSFWCGHSYRWSFWFVTAPAVPPASAI